LFLLQASMDACTGGMVSEAGSRENALLASFRRVVSRASSSVSCWSIA
jgi:hypothetical protein